MGLRGLSIAGRLRRNVTEELGEGLGDGDLCAAAAITDRGRMRRGNEDAMAARVQDGAFVVCDGMGGACGGAIASRLAADAAIAELSGTPSQPPLDSGATLRRAVRRANAAVLARAGADRRLRGMGTTLVSLLVCRSGPGQAAHATAWVGHVGDSRCYLLRDGRLEQLTRDHSWVEEQMQSGRMTAAQARRSSMAHVITRAIGTRSEVEPDVMKLSAAPGDLFLLATDGLTREVPDTRIAQLLQEAGRGVTLEQACGRLVASANAAGGRDNITCILIRIH